MYNKNLNNMERFFLRGAILLSLIWVTSCTEEDSTDSDPNPDPSPTTTDYAMGYNGNDDMSQIPTTTNFGFNNSNLPSSVDLVSKFPPMGDQGRYGTCVSWAVAYNTKTAVSGMKANLSASQLSSPANQASPKDLFTAIPDTDKGSNCNGTNFESALSSMQDRGVASLQTVPYNNLGDCSSTNTQSSWTQEANQNKIEYWRKIDPTVESVKQNLANNVPVILGARLADNFMSWNSDDVMTSHSTFDNVGIHAYHALTIAGYDDSKGPNGAFKIINSWGTGWGNSGYIWIDYNFMINDFCDMQGNKPLFIMSADEGNTPPDEDDDNQDPITGVDLAPWVFSDYSTYSVSGNPYERLIDFNVYNIGSQTASASSNWSVYYIYFNAYNANDYGVVYYDEFNTSIPDNTFDCPEDYHCIINLDLPGGTNLAQLGWGENSVYRTYNMPQITGAYYLLLVVDAQDVFAEHDEMNNLFYTTLNPIWFNQGYANRNKSEEFDFSNKLEPTNRNLKESKFNSVVTEDFPNAYTQKEIKELLKREKLNGTLDSKVQEFKLKNKSPYSK